MTPATRIVFTETLSNPLLRLADIAGLAAITRPAGVILAVDHTFAPLLCRPIALGADVVTHSVTKSIGGHSDVTLGALVGRSDWIKRTAHVASTFGLTGNPFDSWLALRGMATLAVRTDRACANALELARRLEAHPAVERVHYPGLASHPDHDLATRTLTGGFGSIVTFDVGGRDQADSLIRGLRHIPYAPSLGDVSTSLSHPTTTSHRSQTPEQWARQGITPGLIRLSVGIEAVDDLWADLATPWANRPGQSRGPRFCLRSPADRYPGLDRPPGWPGSRRRDPVVAGTRIPWSSTSRSPPGTPRPGRSTSGSRPSPRREPPPRPAASRRRSPGSWLRRSTSKAMP